MGPLITAEHRVQVASFVDGKDGFRGEIPDGRGFWFPCTVVGPFTNEERVFFFQAEDGIRAGRETGVQTCALPILLLVPLEATIGTRRMLLVGTLGNLL